MNQNKIIAKQAIGKIISYRMNARTARKHIAEVKKKNVSLLLLDGLDARLSKLSPNTRVKVVEMAQKELRTYKDTPDVYHSPSRFHIHKINGVSKVIEVNNGLEMFDALDRLSRSAACETVHKLKATDIAKAIPLKDAEIGEGLIALRMMIKSSAWTFIKCPSGRQFVGV